MTGSELRDPETGRVVWGSGRNLLVPRDGGYGLALSILPEGPAPDRRLEPSEVWDEVRLGPMVQPIYGPFLESLERRGYRRGRLTDPGPGETLFGFPYEWRRSNVASARALLARLDALRRARGAERLVVDLICQSNGVHVCRYLVRYGGATLTEAEAGAGPPPWLALTPAERTRLAGQPFLVRGGHFTLILDPATHRRVYEALQSPGCSGREAASISGDGRARGKGT